MPKRTAYVIVGAGLAGAKAAETLRQEGFDGRVVLLGEEPERPYERPPLSKDLLRGESAPEQAFVHAEGFYADHDIELLTGTGVAEVDPGERRVRLADGETVGYDALLLATGAAPRPLGGPGADLDGVMYLRTMRDAQALAARLVQRPRVVVVGAGWIGSEVAASARQLGCEVTMLELAALPLERVLGPVVGAIYRDVHLEHGVRFLGGTGVQALEGAGAVERVRTTADRALDCDLVVVGVGAAPRVELATGAGLEVQDGIVVDAALRSSAPGIYAAGDAASAYHPLLRRHLRVEHWANALNQAPAAARSMLGQPVSYDRIPYFFSDQYELGMEYSGHADGTDQVVLRGDVPGRAFIAFWVRDGCVRAGMNVNVWDVAEPIQALIRGGRPVDPTLLADPDVPLTDVAPAAA